MMRTIAGVLVCLGFAGIAQAALTINVGDHDLQPNQVGQTIEMHVSGGDLVENVDIYAQIADGGPTGGGSIAGPAFTLLDLFDDDVLTSFIFDPNNTGRASGTTNGVDGACNQRAYEGTSLPMGQDAISAAGLVAIFTIDTSGYDSGTWAFSLTSPTAFGYEGEEVDLTINNGNITVIPEPASLSLLLLGAGLILSRRRRSSRNNG